jgi:hypothetical protein
MPPAIPLGTHVFLVVVPLLVIAAALIIYFAGGKHGR